MSQYIELQFVPFDKKMAEGMRKFGNHPLSNEEIRIVKEKIHEIEADESIFVFNHPKHLIHTCYVAQEDKIYIGCDVFPNREYGSTHPRDLMSIAAVLAHEYYGHRVYREEYLKDESLGIETTPEWKDECRASRTAAQKTPGLSQLDRANLCQDAVYRAKEYGQKMVMDDFMKEVIFGYGKTEKYFTRPVVIKYVRDESCLGGERERGKRNPLSQMRRKNKGKDNGDIQTECTRTL